MFEIEQRLLMIERMVKNKYHWESNCSEFFICTWNTWKTETQILFIIEPASLANFDWEVHNGIKISDLDKGDLSRV